MKSIKISVSILSIVTLFAIAFSSCKKNSSKSKAELLTQAGWKEVKFESKTNNGAWVDVTGNPPTCDKDNISLFKTNNTFEYNEGATKCSATDPQIIATGVWAFGANEATISITFTGSNIPDVAAVDQLDESTLVITTTDVSGANTYYDRTTYSH
jgi:hypothetical protein